MTRRTFFGLGALGLAACQSGGAPKAAILPPTLAANVPRACRQVVLVLADRVDAPTARLWQLERSGPEEGWVCRAGPARASVGRNGLAWGCGPHTPAAPPDDLTVWRLKREGDGCAPAGVFALPFAFGTAVPDDASWLRLPYVHATPSLRGVDDPESRFYNQLVDEARLPTGVHPDWRSREVMRRDDGLYDWGIFVAHNHPQPVGGRAARGSCIFIHRWKSAGEGTAGCTALGQRDLRSLLHWLDASAHPMLVQTVAQRPETSSL